MDPFTISTAAASLALGGASLAVQIFQGAIAGFQLFEAASGASQSQAASKIRLQFQYARLHDWAEIAGLTDEVKSREYNERPESTRTTIALVLHQLDFELRRLQKLCLRFNDGSSSDDTASLSSSNVGGHNKTEVLQEGAANANSIEVARHGVDELFKIQSSRVVPRVHMRGLNHIIALKDKTAAIVRDPKSLVWAAGADAQFQQGLDAVQHLVDYLHHALGKNEMKELRETARATQMGMLTMANDLSSMKDLLEAIREAVSPADRSSASLSGTTLRESSSASFRTARTTVQEGESEFTSFFQKAIDFKIRISSLSAEQKRFQKIPFDQVSQGTPFDGDLKTTATYAGKSNLWIEWKRYEAVLLEEEMIKGPSPETQSRVAELVSILKDGGRPAEFYVPVCHGVFQESANSRMGFIYEIPDGVTSTVRPQSLYTLLATKPMALRSRLALAKRLTQCLVLFHAVDWLHKGLRSAGVLFFGDEAIAAGHAYISGFQYARPSRPNTETTKGPPEDAEWEDYIHPDYLGDRRAEGFKRTYDIYSLGIVLLETGLWLRAKDAFAAERARLARPLDDSAQASGGAKPGTRSYDPPSFPRTPAAVRGAVLVSCLDSVELTMGTKYRKATEVCLRGMEAFELDAKADQSNPGIAALIQQEVIAKVVNELKEIVV